MFRGWGYGISIDRENHTVVCPNVASLLQHEGELARDLGPSGALRIDSLGVSDCMADFAALARHPVLAGVRSLMLDPLNDGRAALLATAAMPRLRELGASGGQLSASGLATLMRAPFAAQLERLHLGNAPLGPAGGRALAAAELAQMRYLGLSGCGLGTGGIELLAGAEWLPRVEWINLARNRIDDAGAIVLARVPGPGPVELDLGDNLIEDAGARALCAAPWERLARLRLRGNRFFGQEEETYYDQGIPCWSGRRTLTMPEVAERFGFVGRGVEIY
jgi:hypothetical protein